VAQYAVYVIENLQSMPRIWYMSTKIQKKCHQNLKNNMHLLRFKLAQMCYCISTETTRQPSQDSQNYHLHMIPRPSEDVNNHISAN
jgi:hypothetical protein